MTETLKREQAKPSKAAPEAAPATAASSNGVPPEEQKKLRTDLLKSMMLQRRFEERCAEAYALGKIGGFCHLYIGQEAISAGTMSILRPDDYVVTSYRDHGQAIARGMSPRSVMAELFGRKDGCSGGKGGSMHLFDKNLNSSADMELSADIFRSPPVSAGQSSTARAIRFACASSAKAAVNIGAFHEALNMASLWKLPCVFIIENNRYGMGTAISRATANEDVVARAAAYQNAR
jgi:pyruvate dehydrogenase E1 component alpha subunit